MKPKLCLIAISVICLVISTLNASVNAKAATIESPELQAFDFLTGESGWILLDGKLFITSSAGLSWLDITPPLERRQEIRAVAQNGEDIKAIVTQISADDQITYFLATRRISEINWQIQAISLFTVAEDWIVPENIHLFFLDAQNGWVVVKQATSKNFNIGFLFRTQDGGSTWERLSIPSGDPVHFISPDQGWLLGGVSRSEFFRSLDGGGSWFPTSSDDPEIPLHFQQYDLIPPTDGSVSHTDQITKSISWAVISSGNCDSNEEKTYSTCSTKTSLRRTQDGGQTWKISPLPGFPDGKIQETHSYSTKSQYSLASASSSNTIILSGQGFDLCEITSLAKMQMWWDASPYTAVNLYIGGISRACNNVNLSATYLTQLQEQGWKFIPTWVGPQAPCTTFSNKIPLDPSLAYYRGVEEASAALVVAEELGLTGSDQSGTVIYYDLEPFDMNNPDCLKAVANLIVGWTEELESKANIAGMYGSYNSGITRVADHPEVVPDAVWLAHWVFETYNPAATVWDVFRVPNDLWTDHQRIRQYAGDHNETWGDLTLNIDSDVLDGVTAVRFIQPENDNIDAATAISMFPFVDSRDISTATTESGDPVIPCLVGQGTHSIWYKFSPAVSEPLFISSVGSDHDHAVAIWSGGTGDLAFVGCEKSYQGSAVEILVDVIGGTEYYIEFASQDLVMNGKSFLSIHMPANDDLDAAILIPSVPFDLSMDTSNAGDSNDDPAVPACNLAPGPNSVWFSYTPMFDGTVSFDTFTSSYDTYIAIWSGTRENLVPVGCNDDALFLQSQVETSLVSGETYYIEIGQYGGRLTLTTKDGMGSQGKASTGGTLKFHVTTFRDVPGNHWAWSWVEKIFTAGITSGCGIDPKIYCPEDPVTRAQMAIFLLHGLHGADYLPPMATGIFPDVPTTHWAADWIEQLFLEGITAGCDEGKFCPENNVTRAQMAAFLLRVKYGFGYTPPTPSGLIFPDVPLEYWATPWIEQLFADGLTAGCGSGNFCPENPVSRAEMAVFLVGAFRLP